MRSRGIGWLLLGGLLAAGLGCETVPKADYLALSADYARAQQELESARAQLAAERSAKENVAAQLAKLRGQVGPGVEVGMVDGRPAIRMPASLLYRPGEASITPEGTSALRRIAGILKSQYPDAEIRVEGHTDTDPIRVRANEYKNNWELASKRANEVLIFLVSQGGIDPKQIYSASFAMYRPVSADKAANRRVEIVVLPPRLGSGPALGAPTGASEEK